MSLKIIKSDKLGEGKLSIGVLGESKVGKTHLIKTLPGKTLVIAADNKAIVTLKNSDPPIDVIMVTSWAELSEAVKFVFKSDQFVKAGYEWVVFDSMTAMSDLLMSELENRNYADGRQLFGEYEKLLGHLLKESRATDRFSSLFIFEVANINDPNGGVIARYPSLKGQLKARAPHFFTMTLVAQKVLDAKTKKNVYRLLTTDADHFKGLGARNAQLSKYEPADLGALIKKVTS